MIHALNTHVRAFFVPEGMHKIFSLGGCMLSRPQVRWAADIRG
jgi:hypothetical protein